MTAINQKNQTSPRSAFARGSQSGFSLIELMVAVTISLLIMAAILTLYVDISRNNSEMAKTNVQIENGRFAIQLLQSDIAHGGFWNGYIPDFDDLTATGGPIGSPPLMPGTPRAVPAPCQDYGTWTNDYKDNLLGIPVQAYDDVPSGCTQLTNKRANTDVLVVRHAETCVPGVGGCEADTAGKLYFQASLCEDDVGPYVLGTGGFTLHPRTTIPSGLPSCADPLSTLFAPKRKFISNIYYIRDFAVTAGDGIPTLMRSQFDLSGGVLEHQPAQALIEGIEGFRVELGIDSLSDTGAAVNYAQTVNWANPNNLTSPTNRGDGTPDGVFVRCTTTAPCTAAELTNTVAVKLYVLVRSLETTPGHTDTKTYSLGSSAALGPFNDGYRRHVFSTTVRLTNISGRRETPL